MKHSIKVTIERLNHSVIVRNDKGKTWLFTFEDTIRLDTSTKAAIADVASAMLTGTITAQLKELNSPKITYTLTIDK